jgi:ABC-type antimicrobial peptide transport system permease subunit
MNVTRLLLDFGGGIFLVLGLLHALYTFLDIGRPRRLVPQDPSVQAAMAESQLRLARGGTTMWRAWVGFNFSHSLGVVLFGVLCIGAGAAIGSVAIPAWMLLAFVAIGIGYLGLSLLYWFRIPTAGVALGTACLLSAWLTYAFA